jgi:murein DD-endopeptidase MepM/ murein hydrolase activator NlpD
LFGKKYSGRRAANRASLFATDRLDTPGAAPRRRAEARTASVGGSLRRSGPLALAITATLAAVLIPQASADEGNVGANVTASSSVSASPAIDRVGLVEQYMGNAGPASTSDSGHSKPGDDQDESGDDQSESDDTQDKQGHDEDNGGDAKDKNEGGENQQDKQGKDTSSSTESEDPNELAAPLEKLEPTSPFGPRVSPITGAPSEFHSGQDYAGTCGTPVKSSADGKITEAGWHPYGGGKRITVSHGGGLKTTYNHMSSMGVSVGDTVDEGDRVGQVGSTGASTGCHLHFEVVVDGEKVNPLKWI